MTPYKAALASCASILAMAIVAPTCAYAAETEVEELIVTATKRDQALLDVPFSVSAQSEQMMRNRGITNIEDLSRTVASFTVQNLGPGQSQVAIRGISAGQIVRDQPGVKEQVGVYLDESVISLSLFTPDLDLFDLNRVEVLRGPQGTLFGSGSLSGTVRYITNQPTTDKFESTIEATLSSVQGGDIGGDLKGAVNVPISDERRCGSTAYASSSRLHRRHPAGRQRQEGRQRRLPPRHPRLADVQAHRRADHHAADPLPEDRRRRLQPRRRLQHPGQRVHHHPARYQLAG
jgi:iron complex outermembrane receptor protein